ncbi:MAG: class I SAM-dependent methyltransferase [Crenarchaeota archaeon]|nr:class I SAM-dependent methyltransferase [Thermoproteota archaeon]
MVCHGNFSLNPSVRRTWYNPEVILNDLGLKPGMVFVDVGCADGFFSLLAAKIVKETGRVYSIDIDTKAIEKLKRKAAKMGLNNIDFIVGKGEDVVVCEHCADFVFYSMALHDFNDVCKVLQNAKQMLKPKGVLADLDWKKKQMDFWPPLNIRFSEEYVSNLIKQTGLNIITVKAVGEHHYLVTAKP